MNPFKRSPYGIETIQNQSDNMCGKIAKVVQSLRDEEIELDQFKTTLGEMLTKRFGLPITVEVPITDILNACVLLNPVVKTHPLYTDYHVNVFGYIVDSTMKKDEIITANIDLKKAYVTGSITKYPTIMEINSSMLDTRDGSNKEKYLLTPEEVAACILHEMGHVFTFVEYLLYTTKISTVIRSRVDDLLGADKERRVAIINNDKELKDFTTAEKEDLASAEKKRSVEIIIFKGMVQKVNAQAGMDFYSNRYMEQSADMFAIRNGAGKNMGTLIGKITPKPISAAIINIGLIFITVLFVGMPFILMLLNYLFMYSGEIYDNAPQRIDYTRRELINQLKNVKDANTRRKVLASIDELTELLKETKEQPKSFYEYIAYGVSSRYRRVLREEKTMKEIEEMIDNDLYVAHGKLSNR